MYNPFSNLNQTRDLSTSMTRATVSQPETVPEIDTVSGAAFVEEPDLELGPDSHNRQHTHLYSHNSDDWNQEEVQKLKAPNHGFQSSHGDVSSIVRDAGFSLERFDIAEDRPPEQAFDLTALGAQFGPESAVSPKSCLKGAPANPPHFLDTLLRSKRVVSAESRHAAFIPINELELAMSPPNVFQELQHAGMKNDLQGITASICRRGKESRQRIFAILCMLQLPGEIVKFMEMKLFDLDLPFAVQSNRVYRYTSAGSANILEPLAFFQSDPWKPVLFDAFETYQRQVSAPVFRFSWAPREKVRHYQLNEQLVLPFMRVEDASHGGELGATLRRLGGTSIVRKVNIHPAHYNAHPSARTQQVSSMGTVALDSSEEESGTDFAVKELNIDRRKDDQEALALKRFNDMHHPHLIRLLVTYRYDTRFHMIFPWADGNLRNLWETSNSLPNVHRETRSLGLVRWIATQTHGLAHALSLIHYCPIDKSNVQDLPAEDMKKPHGRHGDLKPENILWFRRERGSLSDDLGTLKIADFGFADFHSEHSRSNVRRSDIDGDTPTYRAPEYDVNQRVSPQSDIWSFGCILLQFVVWYMRGWEGVDNFSQERTADSKGTPIAFDLFYAYGLGSEGSRGRTASAKWSVIKLRLKMIKDLKNQKDCSDYFLDLLEYIEIHLLRVNNTKRAKINDIVRTFEKMSRDCEKYEDYCMLRTRKAKRTGSELSEMVQVPYPSVNESASSTTPAHQTKGLHRRSASVSSQLETLREKKTQDNISRFLDGDQPHYKSPLTHTRLPTRSIPSVCGNEDCSPTQSVNSFQSTFSMRQNERGALRIIDNVVDSATVPAGPPASLLHADGHGAPDTPNELPPSPAHDAREEKAAEHVQTLDSETHISLVPEPSSMRTAPEPNPGVQPYQSLPQELPSQRTKQRDGPKDEQPINGTKPLASRVKLKQSKRWVYGRATNLLKWCFRKDSP
ncbi:hypothetical protein BKA63DRAFT_549917 [Paraphoma chrysanthemicola]|nr:hypothetical protein BKA63DRAFT_549917 [Paraphoma chrysanthemicola]